MGRKCILCSTLATLLLFSGCTGKENGKVTELNGEAVTTTTVTTAIYPGEIGKEKTVDGAVVTLNGVYSSDFTNNRNGFDSDIIFFSFTVQNNTDQPIAANFMQTCEMLIDGEPSDAFSVFALSCTYKQFGDDVELFAEDIPAGETITGYIGAEMYRGYASATLLYTPLSGAKGENKDKTQLISYSFKPDELEYIGEPMYPLDVTTTVTETEAAETTTTTAAE